MNRNETMPGDRAVVTIPKEKAVFWMDGQGRWHNRHGPFEHRKLIAYFNAAIRKDEEGYYVTQTNGDIIEKVYFRYQETALFVVDLQWQPVAELYLNTGTALHLDPEGLYIRNDQLFLEYSGQVIKFAQQALLKLSESIDVDTNGACWLTLDNKRHKLSSR